MADIIRFPDIPPPYPFTARALDRAERALLAALRGWVGALRRAASPLAALRDGMAQAGLAAAAFPVDALMEIVARTAQRPVDIHCPACANLSADEKHLLHAASLAQAGEAELAERALRTALLSAEGAAFAVIPLESLGRIFAAAGLVLRRFQPPRTDVPDIESWTPPEPARLVH